MLTPDKTKLWCPNSVLVGDDYLNIGLFGKSRDFKGEKGPSGCFQSGRMSHLASCCSREEFSIEPLDWENVRDKGNPPLGF